MKAGNGDFDMTTQGDQPKGSSEPLLLLSIQTFRALFTVSLRNEKADRPHSSSEPENLSFPGCLSGIAYGYLVITLFVSWWKPAGHLPKGESEAGVVNLTRPALEY